MVPQYLEHRFEPNANDGFQMEAPKTRRLGDAYQDFPSLIQTHQLQLVIVLLSFFSQNVRECDLRFSSRTVFSRP